MFDPITKEEALKRRYGDWAGNPGGRPYEKGRCAKDVAGGPGKVIFHQCQRANGYGPDELYCRQHAKRFKHDRTHAEAAEQ